MFLIKKDDQLTIIQCPPRLTDAAAKEFEKLSVKWMERPDLLYVLDFAVVKDFDSDICRVVGNFQRALKAKGSFLHTVNSSSRVANEIVARGLDSVFCLQSYETNPAEHAAVLKKRKKPVINVEFINPFIRATLNAIEIQTSTKIKVGKPSLKSGPEPYLIDLAGVISLSSAMFNGVIALCFPQKVILKIYSGMVKEEHTSMTDEVEDGAGELLNIIYGQAKAELEKICPFQRVLPAVVKGLQLQVRHPPGSVIIILPFETNFGPFHLEISTVLE